MWIIKWILWVIIVLFIIYFGTQNAQLVNVNFIKWTSPDLHLWVVMYLSFGIGILTWLFASIFKVLQLKTEMRKVNKENTNLRQELDNLRNISIEDEASEISEPEGDLS